VIHGISCQHISDGRAEPPNEKAYKAGYFPLEIILDWERSAAWRQGFYAQSNYDPGRIKLRVFDCVPRF